MDNLHKPIIKPNINEKQKFYLVKKSRSKSKGKIFRNLAGLGLLPAHNRKKTLYPIAQ